MLCCPDTTAEPLGALHRFARLSRRCAAPAARPIVVSKDERWEGDTTCADRTAFGG
jgi:hypothetical protein